VFPIVPNIFSAYFISIVSAANINNFSGVP
jgi:hypothetical protein